jgi:alpha-N-arabinofuranosidase
VNASSIAQQIDVNLSAGTKVKREATMVTLSAMTNEATNSTNDPSRIVPVESKLRNIGGHFRQSLPGYTIQVVEISLQ